jgi:prepilin-type N-terminal cleavage/methylation domain-containing protein
MAKSNQAGFTLVEVVIALAISSALMVIILVGQRQIRERTAFDASINRLVATTAAVRAEATAGVNIVGNGDGSGAPCPGGNGAYKNVFAGTSLVADSQSGGTATFRVNYYKAEIDDDKAMTGVACIYSTRTVTMPYAVRVNVTNPLPNLRGRQIMYIRTARGGLEVCANPSVTADVSNAFGGAACAAPTGSLTIDDDQGRRAQVQIDGSGMAKRLN